MFRKLLRSVREYKKPTVLTVLFIILEVVIEAFIPFITADLVNGIEAGIEMNEIIKTGVLLIVMALLSLCCGGAASFTSASAATGFAKNLRHDIFERVQGFSFENIDKFSTSSLVTRMTTDVANVQMSYMLLIRIAVRAPFMLVFCIIMAAIMGGPLAGTFVVVIPVLAGGLILIFIKAMPAFRRVFKKYDHLNETIEENVRGSRVVKGFSREDYEKNKFKAASQSIALDFTKAERIVAFENPLMQACIYFNLIFILTIGAKLVISGTNVGGGVLGVGQISAMLTYGFQILMQLMMLSFIFVMITISFESMKRIVEVLDEKSALTSPENAVTTVPDGSVCFEGVNFKYSRNAERNALEDINLNIPTGSTVGIIGGTGSGKSSLVQLISRLYDVTEGSVKVGGIDVREYDLTALREQVAVVLQKNELFSGTIMENLRWGNENATEEEIVFACRLAVADEFVRSFPEGYDTKIEQGGTNVSGGQKQRLCIARALLKKPKILILDDSTSAVDMKTDAMIRKGFEEFIPETTKIIIAQRISSVENSDMIIVMDNGKVSDVGRHGELLSRCEIYREVYEQQNKNGEEAEN